MSRDASITFIVGEVNRKDYLSIFTNLTNLGWSVGKSQVFHLSLPDTGMYDWNDMDTLNFDASDYFGKVFLTSDKGGFTMDYNDTEVGCDFIFFTSGKIIAVLSLNTKMDEISGLPDYTWYLQKIAPAMENYHLSIICEFC